jgi:hypothetical protein
MTSPSRAELDRLLGEATELLNGYRDEVGGFLDADAAEIRRSLLAMQERIVRWRARVPPRLRLDIEQRCGDRLDELIYAVDLVLDALDRDPRFP